MCLDTNNHSHHFFSFVLQSDSFALMFLKEQPNNPPNNFFKLPTMADNNNYEQKVFGFYRQKHFFRTAHYFPLTHQDLLCLCKLGSSVLKALLQV